VAVIVTVTLEWHSTRQYGGRVNTSFTHNVLKYVTLKCVTHSSYRQFIPSANWVHTLCDWY